jgi:hypothetical protein
MEFRPLIESCEERLNLPLAARTGKTVFADARGRRLSLQNKDLRVLVAPMENIAPRH